MPVYLRTLAALAAFALPVAVASTAAAADLTVVVTNVRNAKGVVHVDLCHQSEFLKDCAVNVEARSVTGSTTLHFSNVPPGDYAIQATHDENNNKKVDTGLFGIPKEGVGFSNDAPIGFGPPKWKAAVFHIGQDNKSVTLKLRYFTGPSGPPR